MIEVEQKAFVLHSRPFRENQQLVNLLTEFNGKVSALVYVGQSKKSIKKGLIQPFLPLSVLLKGHQNLKKITSIESEEKSYELKKNYLYSGFYLNELLVKLLADDIACQSLFQQYKITLQALDNRLPIAKQLRKFELSLLDELGLSFDFNPVFEHNTLGFYYLPEEGFVPALDKLPFPCYDRLHIQAIANQVLNNKEIVVDGATHSFKMLMRQIFNHLLENKPLNSRKLFVS